MDEYIFSFFFKHSTKNNASSPLVYSESVVDILPDDGEQFTADRVFLHFLVIAALRDERHTGLQLQILFSAFCAPAERSLGILDRIMMLAVLFHKGTMQFCQKKAVGKTVAQHIQAGFDLIL